MQLMFDLNKEQGTTLILVTHDLQLARRCQRIFRIEEGRLAEELVDEGSLVG